jgi:hypothetical protein
MKKFFLSLLLVTTSLAAHATSWFVRNDGGTRYSADVTTGQCNGQVDASYASTGGTGVNQPCAYGDARYLWAEGVYTTGAAPGWGWVIAGGDIVTIRGGSWRVGYSGPNSGDYNLAIAGNPGGSGMPPPPNGTAGAHTIIRGENFASCTGNVKTQLHGGYGTGSVIGTNGTNYVDYACLDITDYSTCGRSGSVNNCATSYPLDDYANNGITFSRTTTNTTFTDVKVHGIAANGLYAPTGDGVVLRRVEVSGNATGGWNADDGTAGTGSLLMDHFTVAWSGCQEQYPIVDTLPYINCTDDTSGGYGDGWGSTTLASSPGWGITCDHCDFHYNTQDGFDALHVSGAGSSVTVTNGLFYGNMGNQVKVGGSAPTLRNNLIYGNANAMRFPIPGTPAGISITSWSITSNVASFVTATQSLVANQYVALSGFGTSTFFNGVTYLKVSATGLTSTTFQVPLIHANGSGTEAGQFTNWNGNLSDFGRAGDDAIAVTVDDGFTSKFQFNTVVGANAASWLIVCASSCTHPVVNFDNNVLLGFRNDLAHGYSLDPTTGLTKSSGNIIERIYFDKGVPQGFGVFTNSGSTFTHNTSYQEKDACPNPNETVYQCADPQLTDSTWHLYGTGTMGPAAGSRIIGAGIAISGVTTDNAGVARTNPPDEGALQYMAGTPTVATATASPTPGPYSSAVTATFTSATSGAVLCYTTDGSTPTATTPGTCSTGTTLANGGSVTFSSSTSFNVIATAAAYTNSSLATFAYTITPSGVALTIYQSGNVVSSGNALSR